MENNTINKIKNNKNLSNIEWDIKVLKLIRDRIYSYGNEFDEISRYYDHLLSYNICRKENIIFPDEFERLLQLEKYDLTINEIQSSFNYIDTKKDGFIDRIEFITTLRSIPHPISTIHNYIRNHKLTIDDIAYIMGFDIYNCPLQDTLNVKIDRLSFQTKMKLINDHFEDEFLESLFFSITEGRTETTVNHIFNIFNIFNDESYKDLSSNRADIESQCLNIIPKCVSFKEAKQNFLKLDKNITGKITTEKFLIQMRNYLKGKIPDKTLIRFCRAHRYIDYKGIVDYQRFLSYVFKDTRDDGWEKCIDEFMKFLHTECNDDLFIFLVKINNMSNNSNIKKTITNDRLFEFFRGRVDSLSINIMNKFDYDQDGVISMDDLKNIILTHVDSHFFDDKKKINQNILMKNNRQKYEENKKFYLVIKDALNKINMTEDNLFYYLDSNKDGYIDIDEFYKQLSKLPLGKKYTKKQIELFYIFFDEYNNGQVDINIFKNKIRIFKDDMRLNNENGYMGNSTIENLILTEISKYYMKNQHLCDTEFFSILDSDNDGQISIKDLKFFAVNTLLISPNELDDNKILRFIEAISLTKDDNLVLADIQYLMQCILSNNLQKFRSNIYHYCNEGINKNNADKSWINDVVNKIGMFIDENYDGDINKLYDEFNLTSFRNKNQGLSFENFLTFLESNYKLFESYHIKTNQQKVLFDYISNNKKFITLDDLKKIFSKNKSITKFSATPNIVDEEEKGVDQQGNYDYYGQMHNDILIFLHDNFPTCEDAFKYFHKVKVNKNEKPTFNDNISNKNYLTKKEFFDGISRMFPNKYQTNTILNYYFKIFKKKNDFDTIKYSEFNYIYYGEFNFDKKFNQSLNKDSKILTTRPIVNDIPFMTFNSPFPTKEHKKLETPYDLDPLEKIKRLILSSKIDFKTEFKKYINESGNGMANQFEFRNMIKRLDLGLTNIEIEDIINKSGLTSDGFINLIDFYKYITDENKNLLISKTNILQILKEVKQLIYKYYSNPRLAFELNDIDVQGTMDFEKFKKIIYDVYKREAKPVLTYPVMKYIYDYIDIRKDGIIDLNEWNKVFAISEGKLDYEYAKPEKIKILREWETSKEIIEIYKLIARNKKLIRDKVRLFTVGSNVMKIHATNLIDILKNVLGKIRLSQTQWKMIVSLGDKDKSGLIDFDAFIKIIEATSKMERSHPIQK
jgi:Ca2+-binding EF-hand superfamily protein